MERFRRPAEFERQEAVWVGWGTQEQVRGLSPVPVFVKIIRALLPSVKVVLPVRDDADEAAARNALSAADIPTKCVEFFRIPLDLTIWWRDFGPLFLVGNRGGIRIADFDFTMWGAEAPWSLASRRHAKASRLVAACRGVETVLSRMVSEGGDHECNGRGTMLAVEAVEFSRNPNLEREEIESEFHRVLGATNVIWLRRGVREDDIVSSGRVPGPDGGSAYLSCGTGGHVDEFCRFADASTILLAEASAVEAARDPFAEENRIRTEENFRILQNARDQDGQPFRIVRMPIPEPEYVIAHPGDVAYRALENASFTDGSRLPDGAVPLLIAGSYLNFLVANDVVIAQKYWHPGASDIVRRKDEEAAGILSSVFPGRRIVAIDARAINAGGGGIHCITQNEPAP